jgi:hypothetical protein
LRLSSTTTGVGTTYRSWGQVLGLPVDFTTAVTVGSGPKQEVANDWSAVFNRPWGL